VAQIKIYGISERLNSVRSKLSEVIHACVMEALGMPADKRAHRFIGLESENIEICIYESPACNWGFRGMHGDEIKLNYKINV
jgi:hypothetical protein